jgi:hypothetical protein
MPKIDFAYDQFGIKIALLKYRVSVAHIFEPVAP